MGTPIKVLAPATISNLNCGFDVLGAALDFTCDEIIGHRCDKPGVHLTLIGPNARTTPVDPMKNTMGVAINNMLDCLGENGKVGFDIKVKKWVNPGSGLGSSAAGACAGVFIANHLMGNPFEKKQLLSFAVIGEHAADNAFHADNVAPCLLGGVILIRDLQLMDIHRLVIPRGLKITAVTPHIKILTKEARGVLSQDVPLKNVISQTANLASFVHALHTSDFDLLSRSLQDHIIEKQRAHLLPGFYDAKSAALSTGALGCGISGSGPTIFVISNSENIAKASEEAIIKTYADRGVECSSIVSDVNQTGTRLC